MEWRGLTAYPDYEVSESGAVRRIRTAGPSHAGRLLKGNVLKRSGRLVYKLRNANRDVCYELASALVASAFIGPRPLDAEGEPMQVLHRNGDLTNNHRGNLYYGTHQENMDDRERHGRTARGERSGRAKLTAADVVAIRERWARGRESMEDLAAAFMVSGSQIDHIVHGRSWRHAGGPIAEGRRRAA